MCHRWTTVAHRERGRAAADEPRVLVLDHRLGNRHWKNPILPPRVVGHTIALGLSASVLLPKTEVSTIFVLLLSQLFFDKYPPSRNCYKYIRNTVFLRV
jgi:hypothetical protein